MPLEYNMDLLDGITFDKGCYLGQELVARTHYQGLIRKRVLPVQLDTACNDPDTQQSCIGADVYVEGQPRAIGALRGAHGKLGLAHLRLEKVWEALRAKQAIYAEVAGQRVVLQAEVPSWWPSQLRPQRTLTNIFF